MKFAYILHLQAAKACMDPLTQVLGCHGEYWFLQCSSVLSIGFFNMTISGIKVIKNAIYIQGSVQSNVH